MKFSCEKYILQNICSITARAASSKSPIPALEGLLIEAGNELRITGYDLKKGIYTTTAADITEGGSIVVNAKFFNEMIRRLPDGIVTMKTEDDLSINVRCGKSEYNFMGIAARDYPEMPRVDGTNEIELPQNILKSMIQQTIFAVSDNESRPIYTGTLFEVSGENMTLVSIDGYRLAKRTENIENASFSEQSFIVPGSTLSDVEHICSDEEEKTVKISVGAKHISFVIGDTVIVSRRLEGEFMNYRKSIPEEFRFVIEAERNEFISVIDRVALIVSEKNSSPVRLTFNDGSIYMRCTTPLGKAEDTLLCDGNGEGMEIGFNDRYLKDALKASGKDRIHLCLNTPSSPAILRAADGTENFVYMILPVRLRAE